MIKLIFGIVILFVQVKNLLEAGPRPVPTTPEAYYTMQGEQGAQIAFTILGIVLIIWGIRSMMKKAKASKEEKMKLSLWEMFKQVFSDFPKFLESFIGKKKPPYWWLMFWFMGIYVWLSMIKGQMPLTESNHFFTWLYVWVSAAIMSFVVGFVFYWIGCSLFHLFVLISGGKKPFKVSRVIFLYSGVPSYLTTFLLMILLMLFMGNRAFTEPPVLLASYAWILLMLAAGLYSVYLAYRGLQHVQQIGKIRGIIFFLVVPILLYLYSAVYAITISQYNAESDQRMDNLIEEINNTEGGMTDEQLDRLMEGINY